MSQGRPIVKFREFSGPKIKNFHVPEEFVFLSRKFEIRAENQYQKWYLGRGRLEKLTLVNFRLEPETGNLGPG